MKIPILDDLTSAPIPAGSNILVEYDPASQWYNMSLAITAGWLRAGGRVQYHAIGQSPDDIRAQLGRLGLSLEVLENEDKLRILDWYTCQLGEKSNEKYSADSPKVADLSIWASRMTKTSSNMQDLLRVVDSHSTLARFNDEKALVEFWLGRGIPMSRRLKSTAIRGFIRGLHSDWVYKNLEAAHDAIVDVRLHDEGDEPRNLIRIRSARNIGFDGKWRPLKLNKNFEVTVEK